MTSTCTDKERFDSFREADEKAWFEMSRAPAPKGQSVTPLKAYRCDKCGGFHYGKPPKQRTATGTA